MLGRAKPIGGVTKAQTSKTQTSDPKKLRPLKNSDPSVSWKSDPHYFSNITTNCSPRAASLSFPSTEANGFAEIPPERKFALANNFDKTKFLIYSNEVLFQQVNDSTLVEGTIYWTKKVTLERELELLKQTVAETLINLFCFCFPSFLSRQRERLLSRTKEVSNKEK